MCVSARALRQHHRHTLLREAPLPPAQLLAILLFHRGSCTRWVLLCALYQWRKAALDYAISFVFWNFIEFLIESIVDFCALEAVDFESTLNAVEDKNVKELLFESSSTTPMACFNVLYIATPTVCNYLRGQMAVAHVIADEYMNGVFTSNFQNYLLNMTQKLQSDKV